MTLLKQPSSINIVILFCRRFNGQVDFYRNYADYTDGFGDVTGEHWLGLEKMHQLTKVNPWHLKIELIGCDTDTAAMEYRSFSVRPWRA